MSLTFENMTFRYGQSGPGIDNLNLDVKSGELLAIIGASGSGKSTLLRLVAGLLAGHKGRILLNNKDLSNLPVHQRNIGMVFQNYALFPHLTVIDNIAYGLKMRGIAPAQRRARASEMLALVGLNEMGQRLPQQLSGGQQQRVALARALAYNPHALLLDEPLSALDASIRGHLRDQIKHLQRNFNATTLFVTHDQEEALVLADRIAVMEHGQLLQIATPEALYKQPANRTVAKFVGHANLFDARVVSPGLIDTGYFHLHTDTGTRTIGQKLWALIRPENIITSPSADSVNCISGHTVNVRYLGAMLRYDFVPNNSTALILGEGRVLPGDVIAVKPEDIRLLDS